MNYLWNNGVTGTWYADMSIYLRDGNEVCFEDAECRREYSTLAKKNVDIWYVKARLLGEQRMLRDGAWIPATQFTADKGWKEIERHVKRAVKKTSKSAKLLNV